MSKTARTGKERAANVEKRIAHYVEVFKEMMTSIEADHPHWPAETVLSLMRVGLTSLRHYLEKKEDRHVSWDSPFVELHYPIDWNWDSWRDGKTVGISINSGTLTEANTRTRKLAVQTLSKLIVTHLNNLALQWLTNYAGVEIRGNRFTPILGEEFGSMLRDIKGRRKQRQFLEFLFQPFSVGASEVNIEDFSGNENRTKAARLERAPIPPIEWSVNVDGHKLKIQLIFMLHPFVLIPSTRTAYYPFTVGLNIMPDEEDYKKLLQLMEEPWVNPKHWKSADRKTLWQSLLAGLIEGEKGLASSAPSPEIAEAVLSVSAKIKVTGNASDAAIRKSLIDKLLKTVSKTGEVMHWDYDVSPAVFNIQELRWSNLSYEDFERLIFNLISSAPGYRNPEWLTDTNSADKGRDLSVRRVIDDPLSGPRELRVVVQCKHKKCVGIAEIGQLKEQMALWEPPRIDELVLATTGRFSSDTVQWIEKHNQSSHALRVVMWPNSHIEKLLAQRPHLISEFNLQK